MLRWVEKSIGRAVTLLAWFAALTLVAIMTMTFIDVIGRNIFGGSLPGTVESVTLMMGVLVFSGLPVTELNRRHIVVETFQGLFPKPIHRISLIINSLLSVGVAGLLLNQLFVKTLSVFEEREFTMVLNLPFWPTAFLMLIGFALFFLVLVLRLILEIFGRDPHQHGD